MNFVDILWSNKLGKKEIRFFFFFLFSWKEKLCRRKFLLLLWLLFALSYMSCEQWTFWGDTLHILRIIQILPALTTDSLCFFRFLLFLFIYLPICQSICVSVDLFAIHLKCLKTRYYEIPNDRSVKNL